MTKNAQFATTILASVTLLLSLISCSSTPFSLFSTKINAQVITANNINPDIRGRASPIVVRIYELKSVANFNDTNFFQLYDEEAATLGGDLLSREEFELSPGEGRQIYRKPNKEAQYFGVIAAFRDINNAQWRVVTPLKLHKKNSLIIQIEKEKVSILQQ